MGDGGAVVLLKAREQASWQGGKQGMNGHGVWVCDIFYL